MTGRAFRLGTDLYDLAWNTQNGWQVMQHPVERIVRVYPPRGGQEFAFALSSLPAGRWISLEAYGRRLPLQVRVDEAGVWARWLAPDA